jgi:RHS repeat-associated protein
VPDKKKRINLYPFGLKHKGYNNVVSSNGNSVAQKFGYNGVELEESLGLNLHEMDFRLYDPAIGRFNGIDPVTHYSKGTSVAFDNNPIYFADPSGADAIEFDGNTLTINWDEVDGSATWTNPNNEADNSNGDDSFGFDENNAPPDWLKKVLDKWNKTLNSKEREFVIKVSVFSMLTIEKNAKKATNMTIRMFGGNGKGDVSDAFRHMLLQALNAQSIGGDNTRKWSDAHEYSTPLNEKTDLYMDIHNNSIGIEIGKANPNASIESLTKMIMQKLANGEGIILDKKSKLISSNKKGINSSFIKGKATSKKIYGEIKNGTIESQKHKFHYE